MYATADLRRVRRSDGGVRQLRDLLRSDILHGTGEDHLPGEHELMIAYGASRSTVREALALLRDEGWVDRVQGIGTVIAATPAQAHLVEVNPEYKPSERPARTGAMSHSPDVLEQSSIPIPLAVGSRLEATTGECMRLEYLLRIEGEVAGVATNYVLYPEAETLLRTPFSTDWYDYLEGAGIAIGKVAFRFGSAGADHYVADLLDIRVGAPVTLIYQVIRDESMRPFNFAVMYFRSDRVLFASEGPLGRTAARPVP